MLMANMAELGSVRAMLNQYSQKAQEPVPGAEIVAGPGVQAACVGIFVDQRRHRHAQRGGEQHRRADP
jgi:hypothetical protein